MIVNVTPATPSGVSVSTAGPRGPAATIEIGTVETVSAGSPATVTNSGDEHEAVFNFGIPAGPAPVITVDDVTTGLPGSSVSVTLTEIAPGEYEIDISIPKGEPGVSSYLHIAYASDDVGTDFTTTFDPGLDWIAFKQTTSPIAEPVAGDFAGLWKNTRGPIGETPEVAFSVDSVITGLPGTDADVTITETSPGVYEFDFTIPRGDPGDLADAMMKTMYDPTAVNGDAFDMANMVEADDAKIMTAAERTKLSGLGNGANVVAGADFDTDNRVIRADGTGKGVQASAVAIDDSASVTGVVTLDIGNADTTLSRSSAGRLAVEGKAVAHKEEIALKAASGIPASGASVVINNLDCDELELTIEGVSHNSGSNQSFNLQLSTDNGGSFPLTIPMSNLGAASGLFSGIVIVQGLREGRILAHRPSLVGGVADLTTVQTVAMTAYFVNAGGQVNAVRFLPTGGSLDAGTVTPSFRG